LEKMDNTASTTLWFSQERVPIERRYLWFEGQVAPHLLPLILKGLPQHRTPKSAILFVGYAFADLEIGYRFDVIFPRKNPEAGIHCQSKIVAVTQQFSKPFDRVPHGWKTICEIEFPEGIPTVIQNLPELIGWHLNDEWVCVCNVENWDVIKQRRQSDV
jgi:hypothetical protein